MEEVRDSFAPEIAAFFDKNDFWVAREKISAGLQEDSAKFL